MSAYPNPFNPSTTIAFDLNARAQVSLDVYDVTGRLVRTLINEQLNAGSYTHNFDAQGLPSGAYFARLVTPQVSQTARITLIR
ncbi:MAG: T9SS type A sorting domain-containing protein [bacterium]|nr:T9SS type A sorting domain-containing protein [bacterium]